MARNDEFLMYLNAARTARICFDDLQWILEKGRGDRSVPGRDSGYRGVSFVSSRKDTLLRCIREKALPVDEAGRRALVVLHENFRAFRLDVETYGTGTIQQAIISLSSAVDPLPECFTDPRTVTVRKRRALGRPSYAPLPPRPATGISSMAIVSDDEFEVTLETGVSAVLLRATATGP